MNSILLPLLIQQEVDELPGTVWRNWHETVTQPVHSYEVLRNPDEGQSTISGYKETNRKIQQHLQRALDQDVSIRAAGGGWSFTPVAATDGIILGTQRLNYRFTMPRENLVGPYPLRENPVFLQCGISIADINRYLATRKQALRTSGASNGQTIAGALGTGTHGAAIEIGAVQDYVVAIHLAPSPTETLWLERASYPVLRPEIASSLADRIIANDDVFEAALVSFGSLGLVLGVVVEPQAAYYLHAWRQPLEFNADWWNAIVSLQFNQMNLPGANGRRPRHLEMIVSPYGTQRGIVTVMYEETDRPAGSILPKIEGGFGKGDSALDVIGVITDHWNGSAPLAAELFGRAYKGYANVCGAPGEIFKDTSTRGRGASSAMGIPLPHAQRAFQIATRLVQDHSAPAIVAMRFVKATRATLGFTRFPPVTCVLEVDGAYSNRTRSAHQELWQELEKHGIPFTFHWGKMNNLDAGRVRRCFGSDRIDRWISVRRQLLPTPQLRRVFANAFLDRLELSD